MSNHGNYIVSLGNLCRWLGEQAAELGVEIYPGFAAAEVLYDDKGAVTGVATGDMGVGKDGEPTDRFTRGMELKGKYTIIAEGARGSLTKQLIAKFDLEQGRQPQKYGLGLKELWEVRPEAHRPGLVQHTLGWPLDNRTGGGSFLYHYGANLVSVGFVVHLNYANPLPVALRRVPALQDPSRHPRHLRGRQAHRLRRARADRGRLAVDPEAGLPRRRARRLRRGLHERAAHQGLAQRHAVGHRRRRGGVRGDRARAARTTGSRPTRATVMSGPIARDLRRVRNAKPFLSKFGTALGTMLSGVDMWLNTMLPGIGLGYTLKHGKPDYATLESAAKARPIAYPKPDGVLTFDRLTNVSFSATNHEEDQPAHLKVADLGLQKRSEHDVYAGPSSRYCPAGVYEWVEEGGKPRFVINAQNCVHCKTCDIKDPNQNITWVPPEGGGGPNYPGM